MNDYKYFNSDRDITPESAIGKLDDLILDFYYFIIPKYKNIYKMPSNWRNEIINYFNKLNGYRINTDNI